MARNARPSEGDRPEQRPGGPVTRRLRRGDRVNWRSHGVTVSGTVQEEITSRRQAAGREVVADAQHPQYRVRSDKSGRDAVHKPEALRHEGRHAQAKEARRAGTGGDEAQTCHLFAEAVNMSPGELEKWLQSPQSKQVGQRSGGGESVGHASGRRIVTLLRTKREALSDNDYAHMRKVVGYVHRHLAQRPSGDVTDSRWRYSLMNWGHDPLKS